MLQMVVLVSLAVAAEAFVAAARPTRVRHDGEGSRMRPYLVAMLADTLPLGYGEGKQKQGCSHNSGGLALRMQIQDKPAFARRSVLGAATGLVLLGRQEGAMAKGGAPKPVFIEEGLSYIVKKSADGMAPSLVACACAHVPVHAHGRGWR